MHTNIILLFEKYSYENEELHLIYIKSIYYSFASNQHFPDLNHGITYFKGVHYLSLTVKTKYSLVLFSHSLVYIAASLNNPQVNSNKSFDLFSKTNNFTLWRKNAFFQWLFDSISIQNLNGNKNDQLDFFEF